MKNIQRRNKIDGKIMYRKWLEVTSTPLGENYNCIGRLCLKIEKATKKKSITSVHCSKDYYVFAFW